MGSDLEERNWAAVSNTLVKQNERFTEMELRIKMLHNTVERFTEMELRIKMLHNTVLMLAEELEKMKQERIQALVSQFGAGPTSKE